MKWLAAVVVGGLLLGACATLQETPHYEWARPESPTWPPPSETIRVTLAADEQGCLTQARTKSQFKHCMEGRGWLRPRIKTISTYTWSKPQATVAELESDAAECLRRHSRVEIWLPGPAALAGDSITRALLRGRHKDCMEARGWHKVTEEHKEGSVYLPHGSDPDEIIKDLLKVQQ